MEESSAWISKLRQTVPLQFSKESIDLTNATVSNMEKQIELLQPTRGDADIKHKLAITVVDRVGD